MRGLYVIIDPEHCGRHTPIDLTDAALRGGCCALQLRAKRLDDEAYLRLATPVLAACRSAGVPFFVNDRVGAALALGADGLHLGQTDMPIAEARQRVGSMRIGLSTHGPQQAEAAVAAGADLIGYGPVFDTSTKERPDATVGPAAAGRITASMPIPVVAIGGIGEDNVDALAQAGVRVAAVISALSKAADPLATARRLHLRLSGG